MKVLYIDDPTNGQCSVDQSRDCGADGCVSQLLLATNFYTILTFAELLAIAISNYTQRVLDTTLSDTQRLQATKFLTHVRAIFRMRVIVQA